MSPGEGCAKFHSQLRTTGLTGEIRFYRPIITMQWEGLEFVGSTVGALRREQPDTLEWRRRKTNASICVKHPPMAKYIQKETVTMIDNRRRLLSTFYVSWTVLNILQTLIHLILPTAVWGGFLSSFENKETGIERFSNLLRSHRASKWWSQDSKPRQYILMKLLKSGEEGCLASANTIFK